jgi:hypothetical protein
MRLNVGQTENYRSERKVSSGPARHSKNVSLLSGLGMSPNAKGDNKRYRRLYRPANSVQKL